MTEKNKDDEIAKLTSEGRFNEDLLAQAQQMRKSLENEIDQTVKENVKLRNAVETSDSELTKMHKQLDQKF